MLTLLFLCTGNYYRSRFAEILFNALVGETALPWRACSRGLAIERGVNNVGPLSKYVVKGLEARGIPLDGATRIPLQVYEHDLSMANLIIALKEAEHRGLLEERFPRWTDSVEYWHIHDLDRAAADDALAVIEREIKRLIVRLSRQTRV